MAVDANQFDALATRFTTQLIRRRSVGLLSLVGLTGTSLSDEAEGKPRKRKKVRLCLNGETITVPRKKKGGYLSQGATQGACVALSCPTGQTRCGSACVNLSSDHAHCGACSSPCGAGQACSAGLCVCTPASCPNGCCNGTNCLSGDSATSCGRAGNACDACPGVEACSDGVCQGCSSTCTAGCCSGSTCLTSGSNSRCGDSGAPCQVCTGAATCGGGGTPGICGS